MTQTKNRRSRPRPPVQFKRVQSFIAPENYALLRAEAKPYGQSMSEIVNDAVITFCRMLRFESVLDGTPLRRKGR